MDSLRLGRGLYLIIWGLLCVVQALVLNKWLAMDQTALALALAGGAQVLKVPVSAARLNDLGREPTEALLALVPLVNVGLAKQLLAATPRQEIWEKRRAKWIDEPNPLQAFGFGVWSTLGILPMVLLLSIAWAGAHTWTGYRLAGWVEALQLRIADGGAEEGAIAAQVCFGFGALFGLWTLLQVFKRHTASRATWLPALLLLPAILAGLGFTFLEAGPVPSALVFTAWDLAWICLADAALVVVFVTAADLRLRQEKPTAMRLFDAMGKRTFDVAGPFGGAWTAIMVGMQVVIPGIHYALQYSLVGPVAVLEPDAAALKRSTALTMGVRRRIFVLLALGFYLTLVVQVVLVWRLDGLEVLGQFLVMPTAMSELTAFVAEFIGTIIWACTTMGLVLIYKGRVARLDKRPVVTSSSTEEPKAVLIADKGSEDRA